MKKLALQPGEQDNMPIHAPGKRDRHGKRAPKNRKIAAMLSLTAMVDMFTVLTVFLLQNYNTTGEVLFIPKEVELPSAQSTKELKPAHVITISEQFIFLDEQPVLNFMDVKEQKDWFVRPLAEKLTQKIREEEVKYRENLKTQLRQVVGNQPLAGQEIKAFRKVTVQADRKIDFMTIKKVMFTITESGAEEINFAVIRRAPETL